MVTEDDLLIGRMALRSRLITEEQLKEALKIQEESQKPRRLGEILVEMGYLKREQLALLLRAQGRKMDTADKRLKLPKRDILFGAIAVKLGMATQEQINLALRKQAQLRERGENVPLGKILFQEGVLTLSQVYTILAHQRKSIMVCSGCGKRYNVLDAVPGKETKCPECGGTLKEPATIEKVEVNGSLKEEVKTGKTRIGEYIIIEELSRGGWGIVYKAKKVGEQGGVALKTALDERLSLPQEKERFRQEAGTLKKLLHPNIVKLLDVFEHGDKQFFVMEFIEGKTLRQILIEGRLSQDEALRITKAVAEALHYAHQQGIYHRDIKPENIMIENGTGRVVVMDFGLAVRQEQMMRLTRTGFAVGTPPYMAPEAGAGSTIRSYDARSDIYSLGCILFEMLTGRLPFEAETPLEILVRKMNEEPPSVRRFNPDVPEKLALIVAKAMSKEKENRFGSAKEFKEAIEEYERETLQKIKLSLAAAKTLRSITFVGSSAAIAYALYATIRFIIGSF